MASPPLGCGASYRRQRLKNEPGQTGGSLRRSSQRAAAPGRRAFPVVWASTDRMMRDIAMKSRCVTLTAGHPRTRRLCRIWHRRLAAQAVKDSACAPGLTVVKGAREQDPAEGGAGAHRSRSERPSTPAGALFVRGRPSQRFRAARTQSSPRAPWRGPPGGCRSVEGDAGPTSRERWNGSGHACRDLRSRRPV